MKKLIAIVIAFAAISFVSCQSNVEQIEQTGLKPRLVVLTDIGDSAVEPDDNESAVRLMSYADRFEIEAICCTVGWNCDPYPAEWSEYLFNVFDGYEVDVHNLMKRSGQEGFLPLEQERGRQALGYWPSVEYIRSRAMLGSSRAGIGVIGEGNDSPGSDMLIKLADEDDDRPIYVCAWGSGNTLSQAIWRVQQTRTPEEVKAFVRKFRLYTITDQDMVYGMRNNRAYSSHMWLRREFADDLILVWDECAWLNQNNLGVAGWALYQEHVQGHGKMGREAYPDYLWGVEGDTPSFLNAMPNGLNDPDDPTQVGWGGVHEFAVSPDRETYAWTNYWEPLRSISNAYEHKFYPDEFNDFAARMQWADEGVGNHNPVVVIDGTAGPAPVRMTVPVGRRVRFDASGTWDPDGDNLTFYWWFQHFPFRPEGSSLRDSSSSLRGRSSESPTVVSALHPSAPEIKGYTSPCASMVFSEPGEYHLVCEVHDDGEFTLPAYRRVIITVE